MESTRKKVVTRSRLRIGDIFEAGLEKNRKKYFQYVADDLTQLNSRVIRVFKHVYKTNEEIDLNKIVKGEVEFFAHVFLPVGVKLGYWKKIGYVPEVGTVDIFFRNSTDSGNPHVKRSDNWHVWKINGPFRDVGRLEGKYQEAEIGVVIPPDSIVHRMQTGSYDFVYPSF